ncbi:hypothetical protein [Couchioplanes caeruleus]|uniref:hypothetical protein n=1 Tax=Couchioplanes caeruleus TaxID=56438 RepID=UPI003144E2EC
MSNKEATGIHVAKSGKSMADGNWHTIECRRAGTMLSILVDDRAGGQRDTARRPVGGHHPAAQPGWQGYGRQQRPGPRQPRRRLGSASAENRTATAGIPGPGRPVRSLYRHSGVMDGRRRTSRRRPATLRSSSRRGCPRPNPGWCGG